MEKKESKDHQEDERLRLDKDFEDMLTGSVIKYKPNKGDSDYDEEIDGNKTKGNDDYDVALRTMAYEVKVQPSDRTKTEEELALSAREKLEELEAARIKRMKRGAGGGVSLDADEDAMVDDAMSDDKRKRTLNDDEDPYYNEYAADNKKKIQKRLEKEQLKRGMMGGGADDHDGEDWEEEEDDWEDEDGGGLDNSEEEDDEDDEDSEDSDMEEEELEVPDGINPNPTMTNSRFSTPRVHSSDVNELMPHKLLCPATMEAFDELIVNYVTTTADINAMIERILVYNSVKLPGSEGVQNRTKMHNFLDILIKHFIRVGDKLACVNSDEEMNSVMSEVSSC